MKYQLKNRIADINHRFYLHQGKIKEGDNLQEDGTTVRGGGYQSFFYEDRFQIIKVQIDKEIKNIERGIKLARKESARPTKLMPSRRTLKGK